MKNTDFKWTKKKSTAAIYLAGGYTIREAAVEAEVKERTIYLWKKRPEFLAEVDRLSLMTDIAGRAERLRIAKKVIRQKMIEGKFKTNKDLLDWLKYAQGETDGIKLDLAAITEAAAFMADSRSSGTGEDKQEESESSTDSTE